MKLFKIKSIYLIHTGIKACREEGFSNQQTTYKQVCHTQGATPSPDPIPPAPARSADVLARSPAPRNQPPAFDLGPPCLSPLTHWPRSSSSTLSRCLIFPLRPHKPDRPSVHPSSDRAIQHPQPLMGQPGLTHSLQRAGRASAAPPPSEGCWPCSPPPVSCCTLGFPSPGSGGGSFLPADHQEPSSYPPPSSCSIPSLHPPSCIPYSQTCIPHPASPILHPTSCVPAPHQH